MDLLKHKYVASRIQELETELVRLKQSYRFQFGNILADFVGNPKGLPKLAKQLFGLYRQYTYSNALAQLNCSLEIGQPNDPRKAYLADGNIPIRRLKRLSRFASKRKGRIIKAPQNTPTDYEKVVTQRLKELSELAKRGIIHKTLKTTNHKKTGNNNIAIILHNGLPIAINGYTLRSEKLLNGLKNRQLNVTALLRSQRLDMPLPYKAIGDIIPADESLESYIFSYSKAIEEALRHDPPQLIHAASNYITGLAAGLAARRLGIPFIYEVRGLWEVTRASVHPGFETSIGYAVQKRLETQCALLADRVLAISTPLADTLVRRGVSRETIRILPNGASIPDLPKPQQRLDARLRLGAREDDVVVGFIGSVTPYEGLETLLNSISVARARGAKIRLAVVGSGPTRAVLEAKAAQLNLTPHCCFLGRVSPEEAAALHYGLDIASYVRDITPVAKIIPPLKPLQSMASGVATLVSDSPALVELVGGEHTIAAQICPASDSRMLALTLMELAENNQKRYKLSITGREWVKDNRSWLSVSQQLTNVYMEFVDTLGVEDC